MTAPSPTAPSVIARLAAQAARMESATNAAVGQVTTALPALSTAGANAALETAVPIPVRGAARFLEELADHMAAHPDALTSGSSLPTGSTAAGRGAARSRTSGRSPRMRALRKDPVRPAATPPRRASLRFVRRPKPQPRNLRTLPP